MVWVRLGGGGRRGWGAGGSRPPRAGGGGCLRDLLFLDAGCCLAEALGCGPQLVLLVPAALGLLLRGAPATPAGASRAAALVRLYQERISAHRAQPCCRMTPSCSAYALDALAAHGTVPALPRIAARLLRCRPGGPTGADPVR